MCGTSPYPITTRWEEKAGVLLAAQAGGKLLERGHPSQIHPLNRTPESTHDHHGAPGTGPKEESPIAAQKQASSLGVLTVCREPTF